MLNASFSGCDPMLTTPMVIKTFAHHGIGGPVTLRGLAYTAIAYESCRKRHCPKCLCRASRAGTVKAAVTVAFVLRPAAVMRAAWRASPR